METIHASVHSLSGSTEYQTNTLYPSNRYPGPDFNINEEEENNFCGANHPSTTAIPPRLYQELGYHQDDGYLEKNKAPTRSVPTSPASPTGNVTEFFVKKVNSEKVYVSLTSIVLGQNSSHTLVV
jgi:hypothetical protein